MTLQSVDCPPKMTPDPILLSSVLLLPGLVSDRSASMTRYARELASALKSLDGVAHTLEVERPGEFRSLSRVVDHPLSRRFDSAWARYLTYPRSLRLRTAGVFHILDHGYAQLIRYLDPERTVITCHDLIPLLAAEGVIPMKVAPTVIRTFKARVAFMARARRVITTTETTKATIVRYTSVPADRISVIPYGVNPTFRMLEGKKASVAYRDVQHARVVLQVATGARYKNTSVLIRAFAELHRRVPSAVLVRIGAPFFPDEWDLAVTLGVGPAIRHLGRIDNDELLAEWYNRADVLVFPSTWEGFGWPPLEAMACGTPVVGSTLPAIAEVTGDAAVLVPAQDTSAIALAIERVLTDETHAEALRRKGLEHVRQFTWRAAAARTAEVYGLMAFEDR